MPKTYNLTTWQRAWLGVQLGALKGCTARDFRHASRVLDKVDLTDKEKELVGWKEVGQGQSIMEDPMRRFDVELDGNDVAWLKTWMQGHDLTGDTRQIADLIDQLGITYPEEKE